MAETSSIISGMLVWTRLCASFDKISEKIDNGKLLETDQANYEELKIFPMSRRKQSGCFQSLERCPRRNWQSSERKNGHCGLHLQPRQLGAGAIEISALLTAWFLVVAEGVATIG